jgi:tetratricopeptide (TPR) repeat protein
VLAVGGWIIARERVRAAERTAALAAGHDQQPDAGEKLSACLARDPNDIEVVETFVVWSLRAGKPFAEVEPHLNRLCEFRPDDPAAWRTRAGQRIRNGRSAEGIADGLRALELAPDDHATRKMIATAALDAGEHEIAARALTRLLESSPLPRDEIASMLVRVHLQAGDTRSAERVLDRYFPATRTDAESRFLRGLVHQAVGRHAEAAIALRTAADQSPEHRVRALFALAKSLSAVSRDDDARKALDELDAVQARERTILDAQQQPDNLERQVQAAEAILADGKPKEAAELLERATAKLGRSKAAAAVLVRAYRQLGREDLARRWEQ